MSKCFKKGVVQITAILLLTSVLLSSFPTFTVLADEVSIPAVDEVVVDANEIPSYYDYISYYKEGVYPEIQDITAIYLNGVDVEFPLSYEGVDDAVSFLGDSSKARWQVEVLQSGFYALRADCILKDSVLHNATYTVYVNGQVPNRSMLELTFPRKFKDETIVKDSSGNDLRPSKEEVFEWTTFYVSDSNSNSDGWLPIYLNEGVNTIDFECGTGVKRADKERRGRD